MIEPSSEDVQVPARERDVEEDHTRLVCCSIRTLPMFQGVHKSRCNGMTLESAAAAIVLWRRQRDVTARVRQRCDGGNFSF